MKFRKCLFPLMAGCLCLTSCGLGEEITREIFEARMNTITLTSNDNVKVKGTITSKNADIESKIVFDYSFTYEGDAYVADKKDNVSAALKNYLGKRIDVDYNKTIGNETAKFYENLDTNGYSLAFNIGNDGEVKTESGKYEYQYDSNGRYTNVYEYESFINNGLTYTSVLEVSFVWTK